MSLEIERQFKIKSAGCGSVHSRFSLMMSSAMGQIPDAEEILIITNVWSLGLRGMGIDHERVYLFGVTLC